MRKPFIAGNWKMNNTRAAAKELVSALKPLVADVKDVEIAVAPTFTCLQDVAEILKGSNIELSAQNISYAVSGAYTGEISADMLKDVGCTHAIIGHSERRQYFGETDEGVAKRVRAALDNGIVPIVCVGESLAERESGKTFDVVLGQIVNGLASVKKEEAATVVIAYEPVWAIGTGKTATPDQAQEVHAAIRAKLAELFGAENADAMRLQYGGSVKASNAKELLGQKDIDGALVGGASLKAADFAAIIKAAV
ncbi:MAG: triose-phosphate isomerase [Proteobacteria bacterium]|nr:triose-phosphate isomerase [Pseudomonadota bacterium]